MLKKGVYYISFTLCCNIALAQMLPFKNFNTLNGMIHNRTHIIQQDGAGFIWAGTDLGIVRYDGANFKHFAPKGMPYNSARDCIKYKDKVVFAIDDYGLGICYKDSVIFIPVPNSSRVSGPVIALDDNCFLINDWNKGFMLVTPKSSKYIQMQFPPPPNPRFFTGAYIDEYKNAWIAFGERLGIYSKGDFNQLPHELLKGLYIHCIRPLRNGDIAVTARILKSQKSFLYIIKHSDLTDIKKIKPHLIFSSTQHQLQYPAQDASGNIWLSTDSSGVLEVSLNGKIINQYTRKNNLVSNATWDVFFDKEENLWVATENGISLLTDKNTRSYNFLGDKGPYVRSGAVWNDSILLVSNGFYVYGISNGNVQLICGYSSTPMNMNERMFTLSNNKIWIQDYLNNQTDTADFKASDKYFTSLYVLRKNYLQRQYKLSALPNGPNKLYMDNLFKDGEGNVWCCTEKELYLYHNNNFYTYTLTRGQALSITRDSEGFLWALIKNKGVVRLKLKPDSYNKPYSISEDFFLPMAGINIMGYCTNILADKYNNIWFSFDDTGLKMLPAGNYKSVKMFTEETDISANRITEMLPDVNGDIWLGTAKGIDKIIFDNDRNFTFEKDLYSDKLCGKYIQFLRRSTTHLYVGTSECVTEIDLRSAIPPIIAPPVYITSMRVAGSKSYIFSPGAATLRLSPEESNITFDFIGISYKSGNRLQYKYILEGADKSWNKLTTSATVTYPKIPPGSYTFKVMALSGDNVWSSTPAFFSFIIKKPFYQTASFYLILLDVALLLVLAVYKYRIRQLLKMQQVRGSIARDLHDDIGATVSSIHIVANLLQQKTSTESQQKKYTNKIIEETKYVQETLSDIVWSINPRNDKPESLFAKMQRYASELLEARSIEYDFNIEGETVMHHIKMKMEQRQHFYMIFKEGLNNLVKYAQATRVLLIFRITKNTISFTLIDNGKGFDADSVQQGNGIRNMQDRAKLANATLEIKTEPGKGVAINFTMPIS